MYINKGGNWSANIKTKNNSFLLLTYQVLVKNPDDSPAANKLVTVHANQGYGTEDSYRQNLTSDSDGIVKFVVPAIPKNVTYLNIYVSIIRKCKYMS